MSVATICQPGSLIINPNYLPTGEDVPYVENPMTNDLDANDYQLTNVSRVFLNPSVWAGITQQAQGQIVQDTVEGMVLVSQNQINLMPSDGVVNIGTGFVVSGTTLYSDNTNIAIKSQSGNITLENGSANVVVSGSGIEIEANQIYAIGTTTAFTQDGNGSLLLENTNGVFQLTNKEQSGQIYDSTFFTPPTFTLSASTRTITAEGDTLNDDFRSRLNPIIVNNSSGVALTITNTAAQSYIPVVGDTTSIYIVSTNGTITCENPGESGTNIPGASFTAADAGKVITFVCFAAGEWTLVKYYSG